MNEERTSSIVLAPVAAVAWVVLALTDLAVRVALFRQHRSPGQVSVLWGLGFALFLWAGVSALGVHGLRAILFGLVAGGAIALVIYLRGAALENPVVGQPGAYHQRLLSRRSSDRPSAVPHQERPGRTRELDRARIELSRGQLGEALPPLEEAERVAVAQRKLDELLEVRELVSALAARSRGHTRDASKRLAGRVDEHLQTFPADALAAAGIRKEPSHEELGARFAREQLDAWAAGHPHVTARELTAVRTAVDSGDLPTALFLLEEARRVALAQRKLDELLEVHALAQVVSERSEGSTRTASAQLVRRVEAGLGSFAPGAL
jgi:hypothetical protein